MTSKNPIFIFLVHEILWKFNSRRYRVRQNKTAQHENRNFSEMREYYEYEYA